MTRIGSAFVLFILVGFIGLLHSSCDGGGDVDQSNSTASAEATGVESEKAATPKVHETDDYSIMVPNGWSLDLSHRMNTEFILFAPYDSTNNIFRENVNVLVDAVGDTLPLNAYADRAKRILDQHMPGFGNFRERRGDNKIWMFYDGEQQTMILHFSQLMMQKGNDIYILTFTSNASKSKNESQAIEILESFSLKN